MPHVEASRPRGARGALVVPHVLVVLFALGMLVALSALSALAVLGAQVHCCMGVLGAQGALVALGALVSLGVLGVLIALDAPGAGWQQDGCRQGEDSGITRRGVSVLGRSEVSG